jgi:hypothetical protein
LAHDQVVQHLDVQHLARRVDMNVKRKVTHLMVEK